MSTPAQTTPGYTGESSQQHGGYHGATAPPADPSLNQHAHPPRQSPPPPQRWQPGEVPSSTVFVRRRSRWWAVVVALVALLSAAALVLSIVALTREPSTVAPPASAAGAETTQALVSIDDLDTALCEAIGPAMREGERVANTYVALGSPGDAERDAAIDDSATTLSPGRRKCKQPSTNMPNRRDS